MYDNYKCLALAVLLQAKNDYIFGMKYKVDKDKVLKDFLDINDMWFSLSGVDKEYFYRQILKENYNAYKRKFIRCTN